ncbi:MAG: WxcM-like domain-containing protein [Patescibacteria group bacterium]
MTPFVTSVHGHSNEQRRLLSARFPSHPGLRDAFPNNVPESYTLDNSCLGWAAGGHYHHQKNELFRCVHGALDVILRKVDAEGRSLHATVRLTRAEPTFLFVPAGYYHEVIMVDPDSILLVHSSTLFQEAPHTDEVRALPDGYDKDASVELLVVERVSHHY